MNKRLIALRKALKLTQGEFAEQLGLKGTTLSMVEQGKNALTDKNIKLICMVFNVNEQWLRAGEGDMFNPANTPYETEFFETYKGLLPETQRALLQFAKTLLETQKRLTGKPEHSAEAEN
jgi:transcriptional regulator with XRE-family HTH domain